MANRYTVKRKMAYTADGHLVKKLKLSYSGAAYLYWGLKKQVRNHFEKFGPVTAVEFTPKAKSVVFERAADAFQALTTKYHYIKGPTKKVHKIKVSVADGLQQPGKPFPILALNDELLLRICGFLPWAEQYTFSRVCTRFHAVFGRVFRKVCKDLDANNSRLFHDSKDRPMWWTLLQEYGHLVESFGFSNSHQVQSAGTNTYELLSTVAEYCRNLHSVSLYLERSIRFEQANEVQLIKFTKLPKLEKLNLHFVLPKFTEYDFMEIVNNLKGKLRVLNITYLPCTDIIADFYKNGICLLKTLEELSISHDSLPHCIDNKFLEQIANALPNLKRFKLFWIRSEYTSEEATVAFVREAPKLEKLEISTCLIFDGPEFISGVIQALKEKSTKLNKPFVLHLTTNHVITHKPTYENRDIIQVINEIHPKY